MKRERRELYTPQVNGGKRKGRKPKQEQKERKTWKRRGRRQVEEGRK